MTQEHFIKQNTLFGCYVGGSFIITSLLFILTGKNIALDPRVNNIITLLSIAGIFIGTRHFRDTYLNGYITYGKALLTGVYILCVATFFYALYTFSIYTLNPELMEQFKKTMLAIVQQVYSESPMYSTIEQSINTYLFPISVAIGEFLNKLFSGTFFALLLAGFLRKNNPSD